MANLITLGRFLLLFLLVASAYSAPPAWQLGNAPLLLLIIALDGRGLGRVGGPPADGGLASGLATSRCTDRATFARPRGGHGSCTSAGGDVG